MEYYDLGSHGRPVTTDSAEAQLWFDRGLVWTYAFHQEEAVACFEKAAAADPDCATAHWGIAYALGPNYNKPWEFFDDRDLARTVQRTHTAVESAHEKAAARATEVERALIGALRARYPQAKPAEDCAVWTCVPASPPTERAPARHGRFWSTPSPAPPVAATRASCICTSI